MSKSRFACLIEGSTEKEDDIKKKETNLFKTNKNTRFDLNVNNEKNDLVNKALLKNINTVTGSEMSIYQLQKQFEIYFDTSLDENLLREALMFYLN